MNRERFVLRFRLTLSDYEEAVLRAQRRSGIFTVRPTLKRLIVLWLVLVVAMAITNLAFPVDRANPIVAGLILIVIVGLLAFWLLPFTTARQGYRKQAFAEKEYEYQFDEEGIHTRETGMDAHIAWSRIGKSTLINDVLILPLSAMQALIVPLRACSDIQQRNGLLKMVNTYIEVENWASDSGNNSIELPSSQDSQ